VFWVTKGNSCLEGLLLTKTQYLGTPFRSSQCPLRPLPLYQEMSCLHQVSIQYYLFSLTTVETWQYAPYLTHVGANLVPGSSLMDWDVLNALWTCVACLYMGCAEREHLGTEFLIMTLHQNTSYMCRFLPYIFLYFQEPGPFNWLKHQQLYAKSWQFDLWYF
jgi:hypothetical protein